MKARYKLGFLVQTSEGKHGIITSVITEADGVSYRFDGEPQEYGESDIVASFRQNKPRPTGKATAKKKTSTAKKTVAAESTASVQ